MSSKDSKPAWFDRLTQLLTALGGGAGLVALLVYFLGAQPFKPTIEPDPEGIVESNPGSTATPIVESNGTTPENPGETQTSETVNSTESNLVGSWAGTWAGPDGLSCDFFQGQNNQFSFNCTRLTVQGVITSQGQGRIVGNQSEFRYSTNLGTTGTGQMTLTSDGQEAYGSSLESDGGKISLYLVKQN